MDAETFYKEAQKPEFSDSMVFRLENTNPDNPYSFSHEGVQNVTDHIHDFIIARTLGNYAKMGKPPKLVDIGVTLMFDSPVPLDDETTVWPWWEGEDRNEGLTLADGKHRIPRKHLDE